MMRKRGFTLIELLVVLGVIGVLMPAAAGVVQAGRATVCLSNLRQMGTGILIYANEHHQHLPYVIEPLWQANGQLNFDADPVAEPLSLQNVLLPYVKSTKIYQCPLPRLGYPQQVPQMTYRVSSANNFDGQPRKLDELMTPIGPKYEYSLKYLNGRLYTQQYVDSSVYPFRLTRGVGPFYVIRDFVSVSGSGAFNPPHPRKLYNQLMLDLSVTAERDPRYAYTYP